MIRRKVVSEKMVEKWLCSVKGLTLAKVKRCFLRIRVGLFSMLPITLAKFTLFTYLVSEASLL